MKIMSGVGQLMPFAQIATRIGGGAECRIYDCIGRSYRIGIRFDD